MGIGTRALRGTRNLPLHRHHTTRHLSCGRTSAVKMSQILTNRQAEELYVPFLCLDSFLSQAPVALADF